MTRCASGSIKLCLHPRPACNHEALRDIRERAAQAAGSMKQHRILCRCRHRHRYITATLPRQLHASGARIPGIGVEQLLAVDLVIGDRLLAFGRNQPVDELLAEFLLYTGMLRRIYQYDAVLVE